MTTTKTPHVVATTPPLNAPSRRLPTTREYQALTAVAQAQVFELRNAENAARAARIRWLRERAAKYDRMAEAERLKRLFHERWPDSFEVAHRRLLVAAAEVAEFDRRRRESSGAPAVPPSRRRERH